MTIPTATPIPSGNGAASTAQPPAGQQAATEAPKAGELSAAESALKLEITKLKYDLEQRRKESIAVRRNLEGALAQERKAKEQLAKDAEWAQRIRKLAPVAGNAVAKELWGDQWLEKLNTHAANGGAPTAEEVADQMERRDKALREEFAQKEAARAKAEEEAQKKARREQWLHGTAQQLKGMSNDFPALFRTFGNENSAVNAIFARINAKWSADLREGKQPQSRPWKEVAEELESELVGWAEGVASHEKYTPRFKEKLTPTTVSGGNASQKQPPSSLTQPSRSGNQQSRTLSNDLTAATQVKRPAISDEEREQRARAAYEAALAKGA